MISYSPKARADLRTIWLYTAETWNPDQADSYLLQIELVCEKLASGLLKGTTVQIARSDYLKYRVALHVVFYRLAPSEIEVIRVLHQRMDVPRHL